MQVEQINIERQKTADHINAVVNHPAIRPFIASDNEGQIDLKAQVSNDKNILLMGEHGGCMFLYIMDGIYEVHTQVLPEGRGEWSRSMLHSVAHWMFTRSACIEIMTRIPRPLAAARKAAEDVGMRFEFTRENELKFRGEIEPVDIYSYRIQDWIKNAPFVARIGHEFHEQLNEEAVRIGLKSQPHEDDENHNRYVGACVEMARAGFMRKGVAFYNRWAVASRHAIIALVSENPPLVRMDIGILSFENKKIRVIPCH